MENGRWVPKAATLAMLALVAAVASAAIAFWSMAKSFSPSDVIGFGIVAFYVFCARRFLRSPKRRADVQAHQVTFGDAVVALLFGVISVWIWQGLTAVSADSKLWLQGFALATVWAVAALLWNEKANAE